MIIVAKRSCCGTVFAAVVSEHADKEDIATFQTYADIGHTIGVAQTAKIEPCKCSEAVKEMRNQLPERT